MSAWSFGVQPTTTRRPETSSAGPAGSRIVRANEREPLHGPGVTPVVETLGKFARTCQDQMPVPLRTVGVADADGTPLKFRTLPFGKRSWNSYETAPGTGSHVHVGTKSPAVGLSALGTGAGSVFENARGNDHRRPMPAPSWTSSASARTRQ